MQNIKEYKKILGLQDDFTLSDLKKAYRKAVINNHPDRYYVEKEKEEATERMKKIIEAYEFLKQYKSTTQNTKSSNRKQYYEHKNNKTSNEKGTKSTKENKSKTHTSSMEDLIKILENAINTNSKIELQYKAKNNNITNRIVIPISLDYGLYDKKQIYLRALLIDSQKKLTFRLDRILKTKKIKDSGTKHKEQSQDNKRQTDFKSSNTTIKSTFVTKLKSLIHWISSIVFSLIIASLVFWGASIVYKVETTNKWLSAQLLTIIFFGISAYFTVPAKHKISVINTGLCIFIFICLVDIILCLTDYYPNRDSLLPDILSTFLALVTLFGINPKICEKIPNEVVSVVGWIFALLLVFSIGPLGYIVSGVYFYLLAKLTEFINKLLNPKGE